MFNLKRNVKAGTTLSGSQSTQRVAKFFKRLLIITLLITLAVIGGQKILNKQLESSLIESITIFVKHNYGDDSRGKITDVMTSDLQKIYETQRPDWKESKIKIKVKSVSPKMMTVDDNQALVGAQIIFEQEQLNQDVIVGLSKINGKWLVNSYEEVPQTMDE